MKKILFAAATIALCGSLTSCTMLGGAGSTATTSNTSNTGNTAANVGNAVANSLTSKSTLDNLLSGFLGGVALNEKNLHGTWTYKGVDVAFDSENLLAKAGGAMAAGSIEDNIDSQLQKYGIKPGSVKFTFNADHTFSAIINGKSLNGTYTYDEKNRKINLVAALGLFNQTATVGTTTNGISLLFPADKLLSLVNMTSSMLGQTNSTIASLSNLVSNYKGMQIGLALSK